MRPVRSVPTRRLPKIAGKSSRRPLLAESGTSFDDIMGTLPQHESAPMKSLWVLLFVSGAALADDASMLRCRQLNEAPARLACYDAIELAPPGAAPASGSPAAAGAPVAAMAATPSKAELERGFGNEHNSPAARLESIETSIVGEFDGWVPNQRIRLANGQVWVIADDSQALLELNNPKVRLEKGMMGAIYMDIEGARSSPRVKRIK